MNHKNTEWLAFKRRKYGFKNEIDTEQKGITLDLDNGGKIFVETEDESKLEGMKVFVVDFKGKKTNDPAPDGEYVLKDGRTLVVVDGIISRIVATTKAKAAKGFGQQIIYLLNHNNT